MKDKGYFISYEASSVKSDQYVGLVDRDEYNMAIMHVYDLIKAANILFANRSYAPATFISITVYEEIAKIYSGHTRSSGLGSTHVRRSKDPLFNHAKKHKIIIDPLFLQGSRRLKETIGEERLRDIISGYETGSLSALREESLYFSRCKDKLKVPSQVISMRLAAEHILIAIELFWEMFWGTTAEASIAADETDELFNDIKLKLNEANRVAKLRAPQKN
jgi:AbiV family abortive infection protein